MYIEGSNLIETIKLLQKEIDNRNEIEKLAIQLISQCKFQDAIDILKSI